MKKIPLTQNQYALVDDEDYESLSRHKWYANWNKGTKSFYTLRSRKIGDPVGPKQISMHRVITDCPKGMMVDHINHDTLDNRKCNLRICTSSQNQMNRGKQSNNTSGYKGVHWCKSGSKWAAIIIVNKKYNHLGYFYSKEDAYSAYCMALEKYHGDFSHP